VLGIDVGTDALIECMLTPPLSRREAERLLRDPTKDPSAPSMTPFATAHLHARVCAAAARARDLDIALHSDVAPVLPIIARALTGAPDGIAWPETLAPWEEDDDELSIFDGEDDSRGVQPAANRPRGDAAGRRRAKRKAQRSARKQSRGR
jgi:hypothetical protein